MKYIVESLLKEFYIQEGYDAVRYESLSEEDKEMFSKTIVAQIVKSIEDRSYALDNVMINKSKGDLEKLENYHYIKESLDLLNSMNDYSSNGLKIPHLNTLNDAHNNLLKFSDDFQRGYRLRNETVMLFYSQLVLALVQSLSFIIASSMDYVKDPMGNYEANLRYNVEKLNKYPTVNIECLEKFNLIATNGELNHFFNKVYTDKNLAEANVFAELLDITLDGVEAGVSLLGIVGRTLVTIARLIPSIPELLRMLVSLSYFTRVKISDYFKLQAYYIELNIDRQRNLVNPDKKIIKKQEKIMKELIKLSDAIDIDQKNASKMAKVEVEKENKKISKSIKQQSSDSGYTSSKPEEIIL